MGYSYGHPQHETTSTDAERECPGCGLPESDFVLSSGFISQEGEIFCCRSCAQGELCLCNPTRLAGSNAA